jgi:acylphosphatase
MSTEQTRKLLISGKVQGVGFRAFTQDMARNNGVKGFVRNLSDGRVEVIMQADSGVLDSMQDKLKSGPPTSVVKDIEVEDVTDHKSFEKFSIKH